MNAEAIATQLGLHETKLENHGVRLSTAEEFIKDVKSMFRKIIVGLILAGVAALIDVAVHH